MSEKTPEQELDDVFHALPDWVRSMYPDKSLAERVKLGFEFQQKTWTETFLSEVRDHEKVKAFLIFLTRSHGMDFGEEYWKFLISKDLEAKKKSEKVG